jgi:hypothetical protein
MPTNSKFTYGIAAAIVLLVVVSAVILIVNQKKSDIAGTPPPIERGLFPTVAPTKKGVVAPRLPTPTFDPRQLTVTFKPQDPKNFIIRMGGNNPMYLFRVMTKGSIDTSKTDYVTGYVTVGGDIAKVPVLYRVNIMKNTVMLGYHNGVFQEWPNQLVNVSINQVMKEVPQNTYIQLRVRLSKLEEPKRTEFEQWAKTCAAGKCGANAPLITADAFELIRN